MKDCFELRFNLHRCGVDFKDDPTTFSRIFPYDERYIEGCLTDYDDFLAASAEEIWRKYKNNLAPSPGNIGDMDFFKDKKILFVGDSITSDRVSYFNIIKRTVNADCMDGAVSGAKSTDAVSRIRMLMDTFKPDLVSIMIGTNDVMCVDDKCSVPTVSLPEYEKNLEHIVECVEAGGAEPIVTTIPPIHEKWFKKTTGAYKSLDNSIILKYNKSLERIAEKHHAAVNRMSDVYIQYDQDSLFEPDGVHLCPLAQKILAENLLSLIEDVLKSRFQTTEQEG